MFNKLLIGVIVVFLTGCGDVSKKYVVDETGKTIMKMSTPTSETPLSLPQGEVLDSINNIPQISCIYVIHSHTTEGSRVTHILRRVDYCYAPNRWNEGFEFRLIEIKASK